VEGHRLGLYTAKLRSSVGEVFLACGGWVCLNLVSGARGVRDLPGSGRQSSVVVEDRGTIIE